MNDYLNMQKFMKFSVCILLINFGLIAAESKEPEKITDFHTDEIRALLFKVADWQNAHTEHVEKYGPLNWHLATYYVGLMETYKELGGRKYFDFLYQLGEQHGWGTEDDIYDADRMAIGQIYIDIFKEKQEPEIIERIRWVLDAHLKRRPDTDVRFEGNEYRREWWTWCDALFMAPPTFAKMYELTGEEKYLNYAIKHWLTTTDYLWSEEHDLVYRDDRYFDRTSASGKAVFWSRGNGWVFGGLVHMLKIIPKDHPKRPEFVKQFKEMAAKLKEVQHPDGMWRPSLLDEKEFPEPETSGSAFFCYGMLWGINNGLLPEEDYEAVAVKAWNALVDKVDNDGMVGYVQPPGVEPKSFASDDWHEYGTGAFLLAGVELYRSLSETSKPIVFSKGKLLYERALSSAKDIEGWSMEGPGLTTFAEGWMEVHSPNEEGHHVLWCPEDFPGSFIAEWEVQNVSLDSGLCIVFFSSKAINGQSIFHSSVKERNGVFKQYTKSDMNCYHISYFAFPEEGKRHEVSHLRKNKGFNLVQIGRTGIPLKSDKVHQMRLVKKDNRIVMFLDDREIIDWVDDGKTYGEVLQEGKIGFRQMQWTHFRYRNFKVWKLKGEN